MNIKDLLHQIRYFFLTADLQLLIISPLLVGLCFFASVLAVAPTYTGATAQNVLISLGFFSWAISGVPKVIRAESVYGPIHLYSVPAIIDGIITILLSLALASIPIFVMTR